MSAPAPAGYAYCITNRVNGKKYIGITSDVSRRWKAHLWRTKEHCHRPLYAAFDKHGRENFAFEILACARAWQDILDVERLLIEQHRAYINEGGHGYNLTKGGEGVLGMRHSPATLAKLRSASTGKRHSEVTLAKLRGRKLTQEHMAKLIGRKATASHRSKISAALKGRPLPADLRAKLVGKKRSPMQIEAMRESATGRRHSETARANMRAAWRAKGESHPRNRAVITPDGRFASAVAASEYYQIPKSTARCRALRKLVGWSYERPLSDIESRIGMAASLTRKLRGTCRASIKRNRPVVTPDGGFPSATLAGEHHCVTPGAAASRARRGYCGWRYVDDHGTEEARGGQ